MKMNKVLSLLLALVLALGCLTPAASAATSGTVLDTEATAPSTEGPLTLGNTNLAEDVETVEPSSGTAELELFSDRFVESAERFSEQVNRTPADDEVVNFIVVLDQDSLLAAGFTTDEITGRSLATSLYQVGQNVSLTNLKATLSSVLSDAQTLKLGYTYTIATTGVSVTTEYGNKAVLESLPGVKSVYVAPTFALPETESQNSGVAAPMTDNATTMIGANTLNASGYTGKGMKIAILDTGLAVDHPNFAALSEDKLTESSLTRESVEEIWKTLNASKMTTMLNLSYYNSKIPYMFNYTTGTFDVSHATAGNDHGTHVAGIAAANKIDTSEVIGVAPDAQVVVMQVFSSSGAGWDTIMAALEDCVRLDVDSVNLSLGAPAGFTSGSDEMMRVLNLFTQTDIEVVIAAGNDTNNAYMNLWGLNMSLSSNPDIGLAGTPSTYPAALSVASANNNASELLYITVDEQSFGFNDTATTAATSFLNNYQGQTLEFVCVPGVGKAEDYEGIDVTGKVAVISRGETSFPEKQALAQSNGAIACVIYNNAPGMFAMQISDGEGNIPCVSVTQETGAYLVSQGTGTFTVCNGDTKVFVNPIDMSSFTSWGVTPDLKLKPEITGVGGNIYSSVDPSISGSWYGYMSGTSMATPQITGAMAVLLQYLKENYDYEEAELRQIAANLAMSTANPILLGYDEYSPRVQGAGLMDLVKATTSLGYLTSREADEGRPKGEFGDDPQRTGVYTFGFEVNNLSDTETLTYDLDGSVLTESLYADTFISNTPYALEAEVTFATVWSDFDYDMDGDMDTADVRLLLSWLRGAAKMPENVNTDVNGDGVSDKADVDTYIAYCAERNVDADMTGTYEVPVESVTVAPGTTVLLNATITLTDADKAYMDAGFENGIYVEGFLYANAADEDGVDLSMPFVGFYGDWSDAPLFDSQGANEASLYPTYVFTQHAQVGTNPYLRGGKAGDPYNAFSYGNLLDEIDFGMLRNAKMMTFTVTDVETGEVYYELEGSYLTKSYYSSTYGKIIPTSLLAYYGEVWDGKDLDGNMLPDGTRVRYEVQGWLDDGDDFVDDSFSFEITVDDQSPEILNQYELADQVKIDTDTNHILLPLEILENEYIAAVICVSPEGTIMGKYEIDNTPGVAETYYIDITGFGTDFSIVVADYACNETEIDVLLNLGEYTDMVGSMEWDSDRLYGCETFDGAAIEGGWFSANKADFSDPKNETWDSSKRYYSAEFVNGYLIAQNASTGNLELITPTGTYWSSRTLTEQDGSMLYGNLWVLYDMALDHSGTLAASYGTNSETDATDSLLAVGWYYAGDNDNDGHDDGYNALFNIKFTNYGSVNVQQIARISGTVDGAELLTLGITTEGAVYGIDTNGRLYSVGTTTVCDDTAGDNVVPCTYIGTTDFVNYPGYGGMNVIQSMGYDHNSGTMYWYAHSQVPNGVYYSDINVTYKVNLETAECTEVGTYGPGGQTCLFVPNELESDLFTMGAVPKRFSVNPYELTMAQGQRDRLTITWEPWNAEPAEVTWTSSDETVVSVDDYGFITANAEGTATISATATVLLEGRWDVIDGSWIWVDGGMGEMTQTCMVEVVPAQDEIYGFVVEDFNDSSNRYTWFTYADTKPYDISALGQQLFDSVDADGNPTKIPALWQGGAYYNGYVYVVRTDTVVEGGYIMGASLLYRMKVNQGATAAETTFGEPEYIGAAAGVEVGNLGFDYNTGRMYCVDLTNGGLGIIDLDTGAVDSLGAFKGDIGGAAIATAMCVTADGIIVIADMYTNLYTVNPDTLNTTKIYSNGTNSWFYAAMGYDYNTGNIYWNPCMSSGQSPLYLVKMGSDPSSGALNATVVDLGDVGSKKGTEQTVIFTIPENEPETKQLPVKSIDITNGDAVSGLVGGTLQLEAVTVPARPTVQTKTWTSSDESVVSVDRFGKLTYNAVGTATITVSITNKDEAIYGGPFTDSIQVTVLESAGRLEAFLNDDEGGTGYYDFWISMNDYDLRHATPGESMISIYSLRAATYYDGYYYGYNDKGQFMRINADNVSDYKLLGNVNLDTTESQVTAMAFDYTTGTMYGLTLTTNYSFNTWSSMENVGALVTINLDTGAVTEVAKLDFNEPVFALACDAEGTLYAAGGTLDYYATSTNLYTMDKETAALTKLVTIDNACVYTGPNYYGTMQYNSQMTYDFGTNRLYLHATSDHTNYYESYGMFMIQLGGAELSVTNLGGISLYTRGSYDDVKEGDVYLALLAAIPEADEIPVGKVNGILLNKTSGRVAVGQTAQLVATVRPSNAAVPSVTWSSSNETVATVDANGLVTGLTAGTTVITVTSNETGVTATCKFTVVDLSGEQSKAYTVSAQKDALISFNPALPGQTAEVVATLNGGSTIRGVAYGDNCLYYVQYTNWSNFLYRYDLTTGQISDLGQIDTFAEVSDIAYDKENNMLYAVGGFYLFQFQVDSLVPGGFNNYNNYMMDSDYCTLAGVECIDGSVYTLGTDLYNGTSIMRKYEDKYLGSSSAFINGVDVPIAAGSFEMAYDSSVELFYMTDAGNNIYCMDLNGNVESVDILGDGIDLNGLAIVPAK